MKTQGRIEGVSGTHLRCCKIWRHVLVIVSPPEVSPTGDEAGSISCARLKNSSFRRWKRTSTLVTPKVTSLRENLHGFGSSRIR